MKDILNTQTETEQERNKINFEICLVKNNNEYFYDECDAKYLLLKEKYPNFIKRK